MQKFSTMKFFSVFIAVAVLLSGCGATKQGPRGKTLSLIEKDEPQNLDSAATSDAIAINILNNTNEGLYRVGLGEKPVLGMASSEPKISSDKRTYTFKLRDAKWSDDKPVTSYDFVYGVKKALDPNFKSSYADLLFVFANAEQYKSGKLKDFSQVGVKAIDDKTLELKLINAVPYIKELLTFSAFLPQREDVATKHGRKYASDADKMVFNGPFVLSSWKHGANFTYTKNSKYYAKDEVKLDTVNVAIVKDSNSQLNLYKKDEVDALKLGYEQLENFKNSKELVSKEDASAAYLLFNQSLPLFKNKKIRQAISMGINVKELTDEVRKDGSRALGSLVPRSINFQEGKLFRDKFPESALVFDSSKAKKLWEEGLKETGSANPELEILINDTPAMKKDADFFAEQLRKNLGAKVSISSVINKVRLDRAQQGKFQMWYGIWGADYNDLMTFMDLFISKAEHNYGKWNNPEYDQLVKFAKETKDFYKRAELLRKAEKILEQELPFMLLYSRQKQFVVKPDVKNFELRIFAGDYNLRDAYIELPAKTDQGKKDQSIKK